MVPYILRRVVNAVILVLLVTFITYALLYPSFTGIVQAVVGPTASPETIAAMSEKLGYDRPLFVQYFDWLRHAITGDFGASLFTNDPVAAAVTQRLAVTLSIIIVALLGSVVISVTLGVVAAARGGIIDRIVQIVSLGGVLIPGLLVAIALVVVFAINLRWFPATGFTPLSEDPARWLMTVTLPAISLAIGAIANMSAQVRGAMVDELRKDYVRTLRTRGLPVRSIVLKHALRNAAGPALTVLGFEFLTMFGVAIFIEKVFALPGYGTYAFNAALRGDIPVILGVTVFGVFLTVGINLLVDILNGLLTPKARLY